ncbi:hypothetical protein OC844_004135 [Tilletia horrida]|nr:hypothetical protein OC844_004135 [Tilletia horrida]
MVDPALSASGASAAGGDAGAGDTRAPDDADAAAAATSAAAAQHAGPAPRRAPHSEQEAQLIAALAEFERRRLQGVRNEQHPINQAMEPPAAPAAAAGAGAAGPVENANENEALRVRRNLFRASLSAIANMNRLRKILLGLRVFLSLGQIIVGITIASLSSSHHDSLAGGTDPNDLLNGGNFALCQPSAMLVFLCLHIARVAINFPADIYLSLSPHRSNRARRPGADGLEARERNRVMGSIDLDRRVAKISDLLAFAHVVLFVVGNYTLYSSSECAKPPAESIPLFWTTFSFLAIDYLSIIEIAILALAVIFFLPVVVFLLRLFGIADRLPQPDIQPEHKKISQEIVDKIPLVFYVPAKEDETSGDSSKAQAEQAQLDEAAAVPLPPSRAETPQPRSPLSPPVSPRGQRTMRRDQSTASTIRSQRSVASVRSAASVSSPTGGNVLPGAVHRQGPLSRLLFARQNSRRSVREQSSSPVAGPSSEGISLSLLGNSAGREGEDGELDDSIEPLAQVAGGTHETGAGYGRKFPLPHPLHPLPINRATCPICLCDFEEPPDMEPAKWEALERKRIRDAKANEEAEAEGSKGKGNSERKEEGFDQQRRLEEGEAQPPSSSAAAADDTAGVAAPSTSSRSRFLRIPRRKDAEADGSTPGRATSSAASSSKKASDEPTAEQDARLLADVDTESEALEPLRLMECGHVLHRSCLDEWLTGVSGRCPVCSRPVLKGDEQGEQDGEAEAGADGAGRPPDTSGRAAGAARRQEGEVEADH